MKKSWLIMAFSLLSLHIAFAEEIRILTTEEPPTNYYLESGDFSGTSVDIVNEIRNILNLSSQIEVMPWARAYYIASNNENIILFTAGRTEERINLGFHFIGPIITRNHILWNLAGKNFHIENIEDIIEQDLTIAGMRKDWRTDYFIEQGARVLEVSNSEEALNLLLNNRCDLFISSDIEAPEVTRLLGSSMKSISKAYVFRRAPSFIIISKDTSEDILVDWNNAFDQLQNSEFFTKAAKKWSKILELDINYEKETGFYIE